MSKYREYAIDEGVEPPDTDELMDQISEQGTVMAACIEGCEVEPDGWCPHGKPSWLIVLEMV
jgi:hypothetical protein